MWNRLVRAISLLTLLAFLTGIVPAAPVWAAAATKKNQAARSGASSKSARKPAATTTARVKSAAPKSGAKQSVAGPKRGGSTRAKSAVASKTAPRRGDASPALKSARATTAKASAGPAKASGAKSTTKSKSAVKSPTRKSTAAKSPAIKSTSGRRANSKALQVRPRRGDRRSSAASALRSRSSRRAPVVPAIFDPQNPSTLRAEAAVVIDTRTMKVVWSKNPHLRRPVASLTKLMTALVVLDHRVDLGDSMTVTTADVTGAGHSHVRAGNRVTVGDLLRCSLISSDNAATRALARSTGLDMDEFVRAMNARARALGLKETRYADPTGLSADNRSTAADQARLIILAADNPLISRITSTPSYTFLCGRRIETLTNTNRLLRSRSDIVSCKTGFINSAGYCLALLIGDRDRPYLTTVVLGAPSNSSRFAETSKLIDWALRVVSPATAVASPRASSSSSNADTRDTYRSP